MNLTKEYLIHEIEKNLERVPRLKQTSVFHAFFEKDYDQSVAQKMSLEKLSNLNDELIMCRNDLIREGRIRRILNAAPSVVIRTKNDLENLFLPNYLSNDMFSRIRNNIEKGLTLDVLSVGKSFFVNAEYTEVYSKNDTCYLRIRLGDEWKLLQYDGTTHGLLSALQKKIDDFDVVEQVEKRLNLIPHPDRIPLKTLFNEIRKLKGDMEQTMENLLDVYNRSINTQFYKNQEHKIV